MSTFPIWQAEMDTVSSFLRATECTSRLSDDEQRTLVGAIEPQVTLVPSGKPPVCTASEASS